MQLTRSMGQAFAVLLLSAGIANAADLLDARSADSRARAGEIVLVDIRTPREWAETGVPASAHAITMNQPAPDFIASLDKALGGDKAKPVALICRTGNRTSGLAPQLEKLGYKILDVGEGVAGSRNGPGWLKSGLALRTGADVSKPPAFKLSQ